MNVSNSYILLAIRMLDVFHDRLDNLVSFCMKNSTTAKSKYRSTEVNLYFFNRYSKAELTNVFWDSKEAFRFETWLTLESDPKLVID